MSEANASLSRRKSRVSEHGGACGCGCNGCVAPVVCPEPKTRHRAGYGAEAVFCASPRDAAESVREAAERNALGFGAYLTALSSARVVRLKMPTSRDERRGGGGKRGRVNRFTDAARRRLLHRIQEIKRTATLPHFVTLTFPDFFPDFETAKKRLDTVFKRWKRRWKHTAAIWRMEAIERKSGSMVGQVAPHFHMLVWGEFDEMQARIDWWEVNGESDYAHFRYGTDCGEPLQSWKQAGQYIAEYCAKKNNAEAQGRTWGVHNRAALPTDRDPVKVRLTWREAFALRRALRGAVERKLRRRVRAAQSLFGDDPECLLRYLAMLRGRRPGESPQQLSRSQHWLAILRPPSKAGT